MKREKNGLDDFVINGKLTIKELYELAKEEGFEDRNLFFSIKNVTTGKTLSTQKVIDFGKGWIKSNAIIHLECEEDLNADCCPGSPG